MAKSNHISQLSYNVKIIRAMTRLSQSKFGAKFKVTLAMQKSYEGGKAKPDDLYIQRLSSFTGVPENRLVNQKLREQDIVLNEGGESKQARVADEPDVSDQQLLIELLMGRVDALELEVARIKRTINKPGAGKRPERGQLRGQKTLK